ncbi:hypothetical protein ACJMK2_027876 [Sinanodonta woodiana]|uniref:Uncharacterized protein n=1 Tax=Sinanodonta woodiana TaxID=1069815 RepID=A0ABD3X599_SINWO
MNVSQPVLSLRQEDRQSGEHSSSDTEEEDLTHETVQTITLVDRKESMSNHPINANAVCSPGSSTSKDTDVTSQVVNPTQFASYSSKAASFADLLRRGSRILLFPRLFHRGRSNSEGTCLLKDQSEREDKPTKKVKREKKKGWRSSQSQSKPVGENEMKTEPYVAVTPGFNNVSTTNKPRDMFSATMGDNSIPARGESTLVNTPTQTTDVVTSITDQVREIDLSQVGDDIKVIMEQTSELNRLGQSISQMVKCGQESCKKE